MAKNKQKGKKAKSVFQVANKHLKHKNKAKPVTTTLKHVRSALCSFPIDFTHTDIMHAPLQHLLQAQFASSQINAVKNEKVENLNQIFTEIQRDVKSVSKSVAPEPKKQTQVEVSSCAPLFENLIIQTWVDYW